jgi:hypothetical protein
MEISEIAPILRTDKITVTISAEKNGEIHVTYADREDAKDVSFGRRLWADFIDDPDLGRGSPIGDPEWVWGVSQKDSLDGGGLIGDPGAGWGPSSLRPSMEDKRRSKADNASH